MVKGPPGPGPRAPLAGRMESGAPPGGGGRPGGRTADTAGRAAGRQARQGQGTTIAARTSLLAALATEPTTPINP